MIKGTQVCCDYCEKPAQLVKGDVVLGVEHKHENFWFCEACNAWIGVYPDSGNRPLGRLANPDLRLAKKYAFIALGKVVGLMAAIYSTNEDHARRKAYGWLAREMVIPREGCHINHFTPAQCDRATMICNSYVGEREIGEKA